MCSLLLWICIIATLGLEVDSGKLKGHPKASTFCSGKDGVLVPMPGTCSGFFFCIEGNAIASSCGNFYRFNKQLNICDHPLNVKCNGDNSKEENGISQVASDSEAVFVCARSASEGHIFAKSHSCNQFYVCRHKLAVRRICPPQKYFNVTAKLCQDDEQGKCKYVIKRANSTHAPLTISSVQQSAEEVQKPLVVNFSPSSICLHVKDNTVVAHPWDCVKFVYCMKDRPLVLSCAEHLHFNRFTQRCEWPSVAQCAINYENKFE